MGTDRRGRYLGQRLLERCHGLEISQCRDAALDAFHRDAFDARRARDDVPASPPITDTDVTRRPMISESDRASRLSMVRGSDRSRPMTASVATHCIPRPTCAAKPRTGTTLPPTDASLEKTTFCKVWPKPPDDRSEEVE
jgi:hypothetical protein